MKRSAILAAVVILCSASGPRAEESGTVSGSPLDTLMNTRFWTDVPEPKDFVRRARPAPETLEYQPTYGTDPVRPRVRTASELESLRLELERAGANHRMRAAKPASRQAPAATGASKAR